MSLRYPSITSDYKWRREPPIKFNSIFYNFVHPSAVNFLSHSMKYFLACSPFSVRANMDSFLAKSIERMKSFVGIPLFELDIMSNPTQSSFSIANWFPSIFFLYHLAHWLKSYPSPSYNSLADTALLPLFSFIYFTPAQSWARVLPSSKPRNPDINQFSVNACHLFKIELKPIRAKIRRFKERKIKGNKLCQKGKGKAYGLLNEAREHDIRYFP